MNLTSNIYVLTCRVMLPDRSTEPGPGEDEDVAEDAAGFGVEPAPGTKVLFTSCRMTVLVSL